MFLINSSYTEETIKKIRELVADKDFKELKDQIQKEKDRPNIFEIIKTKEDRISEVYAWLLDPKENHGLDEKFLEKFLELANESKEKGNVPVHSLDLEKADIKVREKFAEGKLEHDEPDIRIEIAKDNFCCLIENKWGAKDQGQLRDYGKWTNEIEKFEHSLFIYLTKTGKDPNEPGKYKWIKISHRKDVPPILEEIDLDKAINLPEEGNKEECKTIIKQFKKLLKGGTIPSVEKELESLQEDHEDAFESILNFVLWKEERFVKILEEMLREENWFDDDKFFFKRQTRLHIRNSDWIFDYDDADLDYSLGGRLWYKIRPNFGVKSNSVDISIQSKRGTRKIDKYSLTEKLRSQKELEDLEFNTKPARVAEWESDEVGSRMKDFIKILNQTIRKFQLIYKNSRKIIDEEFRKGEAIDETIIETVKEKTEEDSKEVLKKVKNPEKEIYEIIKNKYRTIKGKNRNPQEFSRKYKEKIYKILRNNSMI